MGAEERENYKLILILYYYHYKHIIFMTSIPLDTDGFFFLPPQFFFLPYHFFLHRLENRTKPISTPYDGRALVGLEPAYTRM